MKVCLEYGDFGYFKLVAEDGSSILIQSDWDYAHLARNFGWQPCPHCKATDGTIDCEHRSASAMIAEAAVFLDDHVGERFEDPGYFESD